jgi:hypothetical protein
MQSGKVSFRDLAGAGIVHKSGESGLDEPDVRDAGLGRESAGGSDVSRLKSIPVTRQLGLQTASASALNPWAQPSSR